jgi:hypothetical protein
MELGQDWTGLVSFPGTWKTDLDHVLDLLSLDPGQLLSP